MPADDDDVRTPEALYGLDLDRFTAARDALAKRLRADGDRDGAAAVKALRRPTVPAWVVNRLVRTRPDDVRALLDAGAKLRDAQAAALGGGGGDLRAASQDRRAAVARLLDAAHAVLADAGRPATAATIDAVRATLDAAAVDEDAATAVAGGQLAKELEVSGFGTLAGLPDPPPIPATERTKEVEALMAAAAAAEEQADAEARLAEDAARRADDLERDASDARRTADHAAASAARAAERAVEARRQADEAG